MRRFSQSKRPAAGSRVLALALAAAGTLGLAGCRQDMHNQPKFYYQRGTTFYADHRSVRPQEIHTVSRDQTDLDSYLRTGLINGKEGDGMPLPVTPELLARGQEQYNVYCTACHSRVGNGAGIVVQRGYKPAGNFHTDRLRQAPLGHFYYVIANGWGAMPSYYSQVSIENRWAIAAYIRALQLSQNATAADAGNVPVEHLADVAEREGMPRTFANDWELPATAVYGRPDKNGTPPGMLDWMENGRKPNTGTGDRAPESTGPVGPNTESSESPSTFQLPPQQ